MARTVIIRLNGREFGVELNGSDALLNGRKIPVDSVEADEAGGIVVTSGSRQIRLALDTSGDEMRVLCRGREFLVEYETERHRLLQRFASMGAKVHAHADVKASMPGLVVRVNCEPGGSVRKGQALVILEAMKMENEIRSPIDGIAKEVRVAQGQAVEKGDLLVVVD
jgi:biotin carboxyl carrier protein